VRRGGSDAERGAAAKRDAFALVLSSRYLLLLACFSLLFTFVNSNGEYILSKLVVANFSDLPDAERKRAIGSFYGDFFSYVNLLGLLLQTFAVSRIVKYGGLKVAFFIFPIVVMFSSLLVVITPLLAILRITKTLENATDYSLNNTVRNMLWLPTTTEMKYKAKQAVDTFMVRMGDVSSGGLVFVGTAGLQLVGLGELSVRGFALANFALCVVWLLLAGAIVRENRRLSAQRAAGEA
jgi:AAA family ATP:ADP antiporter